MAKHATSHITVDCACRQRVGRAAVKRSLSQKYPMTKSLTALLDSKVRIPPDFDFKTTCSRAF